jgi:Tfp pilus assembly protein PilV
MRASNGNCPKAKPPVLKRGQHGMSLISLMIGMLISMIGVLAGFMLYQNMIKVTLQTRSAAAQDGQLASAMLSLQLELQSAGFGIDKVASPGPHLVLVAGPPQVLYWRYLNDPSATTSAVCRGFRIQDSENDTKRQLQLLSPITPASCTLDAALPGLAGGWESFSVLAEFRKLEEALAVKSFPEITIADAVSSCFPFGLGEAGNYRMVTITADGAVRRAAIDDGDASPSIAPSVYQFCIPNIP